MASSTLLRICLRQTVYTQSRGTHRMTFDKKGNREVVGFGMNGEETYLDRADFPMPAIRFKEDIGELKALREKEKGDWRKLSIEEKKQLYRASFRKTFAEMEAPTGEWKSVIAIALMGVIGGLWYYMYLKAFVFPPLPASFSEESRRAQMERMIKLDMNPIEGISAEYRDKD